MVRGLGERSIKIKLVTTESYTNDSNWHQFIAMITVTWQQLDDNLMPWDKVDAKASAWHQAGTKAQTWHQIISLVTAST